MKRFSKIILLCLVAIPVFVDAGRKYRKSLCTRLSERLCKLLFMTAIVGTQAEKLILDCQNPEGGNDFLLHAAAFGCDCEVVDMLLNEGYNPRAQAACSVVDLDACGENKKEGSVCRYTWSKGQEFEVKDTKKIKFKYTPEEVATYRLESATSEWLKEKCLNALSLLRFNQ